jgi:hypothetical protein
VFQRKRQFFLLVLIAAGMLFLAGCRSRTTIADINRGPGKYSGQDVTVEGNVSEAFGALGQGIFQIDDGTGKLWIYSANYGVPGNGNKVAVTGRIDQGFSFAGHNYGMVLRETEKRN